MPVEQLERWLGQRLRHDSTVCFLLSPVALLGGLFVLFLTFWLAYAVSHVVAGVLFAIPEMIFGTHWRLNHVGRICAAAGFIGLLLVTFWRSDRRQPTSYGDFAVDSSELGQVLAGMAHYRPTSLLLVHPGFGGRMVVDILNVGPRLVWGGVGLLREGLGKKRRIPRLGRGCCGHCSHHLAVLATTRWKRFTVGTNCIGPVWHSAGSTESCSSNGG